VAIGIGPIGAGVEEEKEKVTSALRGVWDAVSNSSIVLEEMGYRIRMQKLSLDSETMNEQKKWKERRQIERNDLEEYRSSCFRHVDKVIQDPPMYCTMDYV